MRGALLFAGTGMIIMAACLCVLLVRWAVGPEFWWFVLAFCGLGVSCIWEAWRIV
jgi:hypothetical protein